MVIKQKIYKLEDLIKNMERGRLEKFRKSLGDIIKQKNSVERTLKYLTMISAGLLLFTKGVDCYFAKRARENGIEHILERSLENKTEKPAIRFYSLPLQQRSPEILESCTNIPMPDPIDEFGGNTEEAYKGLIYTERGWCSPEAVKTNDKPAQDYQKPKIKDYKPRQIQDVQNEANYVKIPKIRNNNPGNLRAVRDRYGRTVKWKGQIGVDSRGFCIFDSLENGIRAMGRNLQDYHKKYGIDSVQEITEKWVPRNENNTNQYIARVSERTGYHPYQTLNLEDRETVSNLIAAIIEQEHGKRVPLKLIEKSISGIYN